MKEISIACYFTSLLILLGFGLTYTFSVEFMPYHSAAVEMQWGNVPFHFQVLIIALMRAVGGTCLSLALALIFLLIIAFHKGYKWVLYTVPVICILQSVGGLYAMIHVMKNTSATPPVAAPLIVVLLSIMGLILSIYEHKSELLATQR